MEDNIEIDLKGPPGSVKNRSFLDQLSVCSFSGVTICTGQFERIETFAWTWKSQSALATHNVSKDNRVARLLAEVLVGWVVS